MKSWDFTPKMTATQIDSNGKIKREKYDLSTPWQYPVIVDNMLNMEILMKSNDKKAREMAFSHADATMKNHYYYLLTSTNVFNFVTSNILNTISLTFMIFKLLSCSKSFL